MRVPAEMITYGKLPNNKYMINWPVSGNDYYTNVIDLDREAREAEFAKAREFTLGFVYFLQTELGFNNLGLADDEYPTEDRLALIPYHRESRRIHGLVRYDLNDMTDLYDQPDALYRTGIAVVTTRSITIMPVTKARTHCPISTSMQCLRSICHWVH